MRITDIRTTKRGRKSLFCDEGFLFSLDEETLVTEKVQIGSEFSEAELAYLKEKSDIRKAKDTAIRYLSLRMYGSEELYKKLCLRFDEHTSAAAVSEMCELELLCDETFAIEKAKGMALRGKSISEIRRKLYSLGINSELVDVAIDEVDIDQVALAEKLLHQKYEEKLRKGEKQKVMAALARRGFSHSEIVSAIESVMENINAETEEDYI